MMDNIMKELWVDKTLVLANEMVAASLLKAVDVMTAREQLKRHLRTTPEGFALVPVEPTEAMKRALFVNLVHADDEAYVIKKVIEASKAPPPKSESL